MKGFLGPWTLGLLFLLVLAAPAAFIPVVRCPTCWGITRPPGFMGMPAPVPVSGLVSPFPLGCPTCHDRRRVALLKRLAGAKPEPAFRSLLEGSSNLPSKVDPFFVSLRGLVARAGTREAQILLEDLNRFPSLSGAAGYVTQEGSSYLLCAMNTQGWFPGGGRGMGTSNTLMLFDLNGRLRDCARFRTEFSDSWSLVRCFGAPGEQDPVAEFAFGGWEHDSVQCRLRHESKEKVLFLGVPAGSQKESVPVWLDGGKLAMRSLARQKKAFQAAAALARAEPVLPKSLELWRKAFSLAVEAEDVYAAQDRIFSLEADPDGAVAEFTHALRQRPKDPSLYVKRGLAYKALGRGDLAARDLREALTIDPAFGPARAALDELK